MLLLSNAAPFPKRKCQNPLIKIAQESGDTQGLDNRGLSSINSHSVSGLFPSELITNNAQHMSNLLPRVRSPSEHQQLVSSAEGEDASLAQLQYLPFDLKLKSLEFLSTMSFEEWNVMGFPDDLAMKYHDPFKDGYSVVVKWRKMEDSLEKNAFKDKIMSNQKLRDLFAWKEGLDPAEDNFLYAIREGNLARAWFLAVTKVNHEEDPLGYAILQGEREFQVPVTFPVEKLIFNELHLVLAIFQGNSNLFKYLIQVAAASIKEGHFIVAILKGDPEIFKILIEKFHPDIASFRHFLDIAIFLGKSDIVKFLCKEAKFNAKQLSIATINSENIKHAIRQGMLNTIQSWVANRVITPSTFHLAYARLHGTHEICTYLQEKITRLRV